MKLIHKGNVFAVDFRDPLGARRRTSTGVRIPRNRDGTVNTELYEAARKAAYKAAATIVARAMGSQSEAAEGNEEERGKLITRAIEPTLGDALQRQYDTHWSRMAYGSSMVHVVRLLRREMGHLPISSVTYAELKQRCEDWLKAGKAHGTINRRMSAIGLTLKECKALGELTGDVPQIPHYRENPYVKDRFLDEAEEESIVRWFEKMERDDALEKRSEWTYMRNLHVFLVDTGFRFSESYVFTLRERGRAAHLAHGATKSTIGRQVPLTPRAIEAADYLMREPRHRLLHRWAEEGNPKRRWDWVTHRYEQVTRAVGLNWDGLERNQRVTLHTLRHTCASWLVQRGVDLYQVSKWMGHSSIKVTERYAKLAPSTFSIAVAALSNRPREVSATQQLDACGSNLVGQCHTPALVLPD